jgi:DNA ligase-associated metallophosphoesterase
VSAVELQVGGALLRLLPERAAYLPELRTLLVADAHIGKAVSFRRLGVPVPGGTTTATLQRLSACIAASGARCIVFLGDLLHSAQGRADATFAAVAAWRGQHADLQLTLVRGNHDGHAGDPPPAWQFDCVDGPLHLGGLALTHHPEVLPGAYVLCGHVHPAAVVSGRGHDHLRLPCFHFGAAVGVLPAFGAFTGMHVLPRAPGDRVFVVAGDAVRALP